jgi:hypothetical protein
MDGADPIAAAPAMSFNVLRGRLHLLGFSDRDIRQLERNNEFVHFQFRNPQIAWLFFLVPAMFDKLVSCAALRQIYEDANPKIIYKALKRVLIDPWHQGKGTELTPQQEVEITSWIEEKSARNEHVGRMEILHYARDKYNPALIQGWDNAHPPAEAILPPRVSGNESDIGGIGSLLDNSPEDLPRRNASAVTPGVIPADVHKSDEAALLTARNRKCACRPEAVELLVILFAGDLPPLLFV